MDKIFLHISELWNEITASEIVSYSIATGSLIITLFAYLHSKRTQRPKYLIASAILRNEEFKDTSIDIKQGNRSLSALTISRFALWNTGLTLNRSDVSDKEPIRIDVVGDADILECQTLFSESENGIECEITEDKKSISVKFDYLAKNQGVVLKIFHTGKGSSDLAVKGALKNGLCVAKTHTLLNTLTSLKYFNRRVTISAIKNFYSLLFLVMGPLTIIHAFISYSKGEYTHVYGLPETIITIVLGIVVFMFGYYLKRRVMPPRLYKVFLGEN